jgi:hypothetical protein
MNIDKKLEALRKITQVDAPDFLYTRIEARLSQSGEQVSNKWKLATMLGFAVILLMNILVITSAAKPANSNIETVVNAMNLTTQNHLYDE